jgi:hypothetical protein
MTKRAPRSHNEKVPEHLDKEMFFDILHKGKYDAKRHT